MKTNCVKLLILFGVWMLQNCHSSSPAPVPLTAAQKATALMTASPWTMTSLTIDGVADNTFFAGLAITFTATGFTATKGDPVWPSSGSWSFTDETATAIKRDDNLIVTINDLGKSSMQLTLVWTMTTTSGRNTSVAGKHVFVFSH